MFEFFDFIVNIVSSVVDFVGGMIANAITFFVNMTSAVGFITSVIAALPPFCQGALLTILAISIIAVVASFFVDLG